MQRFASHYRNQKTGNALGPDRKHEDRGRMQGHVCRDVFSKTVSTAFVSKWTKSASASSANIRRNGLQIVPSEVWGFRGSEDAVLGFDVDTDVSKKHTVSIFRIYAKSLSRDSRFLLYVSLPANPHGVETQSIIIKNVSSTFVVYFVSSFPFCLPLSFLSCIFFNALTSFFSFKLVLLQSSSWVFMTFQRSQRTPCGARPCLSVEIGFCSNITWDPVAVVHCWPSFVRLNIYQRGNNGLKVWP